MTEQSPFAGSEAGPTVRHDDVEDPSSEGGEASEDDLLVEEISIDGMCGVY